MPPLTRAETYGPLRHLEQLADEFYEAQLLDLGGRASCSATSSNWSRPTISTASCSWRGSWTMLPYGCRA